MTIRIRFHGSSCPKLLRPSQLTWVLNRKNKLWMFSKGGKATGNGIYFDENITTKTKVIGMLQFKLFPDFLYNGTHDQSGAHLYGKPLFTPEEPRF